MCNPRLAATVLVALATGTVAGCVTSSAPAAAPPATVTAPALTPATTAPAPPSAPEPMSRSVPVRLTIPAIHVDSGLMPLGLQDDGALQVPPAAFPAGWYTGAPTPGELGPAILVGHVHYVDQAGVFADLRRLVPGDDIMVRRKDRSTGVFRVTRVEHVDKDYFPTAAVYGDIQHAGLRLITCGGHDLLTGRYDDNVIAFARLVEVRA